MVNVFFLHSNPVSAARALGDRHVGKMLLEACQILHACHWYALAGLARRLPQGEPGPDPGPLTARDVSAFGRRALAQPARPLQPAANPVHTSASEACFEGTLSPADSPGFGCAGFLRDSDEAFQAGANVRSLLAGVLAGTETPTGDPGDWLAAQWVAACQAGTGRAPYLPSHLSHPCAIWARKSAGNYQWLATHALALAELHARFYGGDPVDERSPDSGDLYDTLIPGVGWKRGHASARQVRFLLGAGPPPGTASIKLTTPALAMPDAIRRDFLLHPLPEDTSPMKKRPRSGSTGPGAPAPPALFFPEARSVDDAVAAYRQYYSSESKARLLGYRATRGELPAWLAGHPALIRTYPATGRTGGVKPGLAKQEADQAEQAGSANDTGIRAEEQETGHQHPPEEQGPPAGARCAVCWKQPHDDWPIAVSPAAMLSTAPPAAAMIKTEEGK